MQILAYNKIERESLNKCPECANKDRKKEKKCFYCGRTYTEDDGMRSESESVSALPHFASDGKSVSLEQLKRERQMGKTKEEQLQEYKKRFLQTLAGGKGNA